MKKITPTYIKKVLKLWSDLQEEYRKQFHKNRITFPEPLQKRVLIDCFDSSLVVDNNSSYDFVGNVELKSSSKKGGGCTPFKPTQNKCSRILYIEIGKDYFDVYDLDKNDVATINSLVSKSSTPTNITLADYKDNATKTSLI